MSIIVLRIRSVAERWADPPISRSGQTDSVSVAIGPASRDDASTPIKEAGMPRIIVLTALLMSIFPTLGSAQLSTRGRTQIGIAGYGSFQESFSSVSALLSMTRFLTQGLEVGGDLQLTASSSSAGGEERSEDVSGHLFGRVRYNFVGRSMTVPYVSLGAGTQLTAQENAVTPLELQAGLGFKHFLNDRVSFNGEVDYMTIQYPESEYAASSSTSAIFFQTGISLYVGK
jgi:hypothetical protein